jgi:glycosyltransferase involved in cell wall biosynthesis
MGEGRMKIGVIARGHFFSAEQRGYFQNDLALDGPQLELLAEEVDELQLCALQAVSSRLSSLVEHGSYAFASGNIKFVSLGEGKLNGTMPWKTSVQVAKRLLAQAKQWDALYIFMPTWLGAIGALVGTWKRIPMVVYLGNDAHQCGRFLVGSGGLRTVMAPLHRRIAIWGQEFAAKRAGALIVQGHAIKTRYSSLPVPVVEPRPLVRFQEQDVFVRDDSFDRFTFRCLYVGSLVERKGVQFLIKAVSRLKNTYKLRLRIAGTGPLGPDLVRLAKREGLDKRVEFLGYVPGGQIQELYKNSDLLILPSLSEGFPRALYEAMSQSVPIVTTEVGGITGLLTDGWNALLVQPGSVEELAEAMAKLFQNDKLRRQLVQNARFTYLKALERPSLVTVFRLLGFTKPPPASALA